MAHTRRLIEEWLPVAALGIESLRERTPMTPFPAPNRLHVWWARRPLVSARAAVLASLLPADTDRDKFMHILGIHGDPVAARKLMEEAVSKGTRVSDPYGYARAFGYTPTDEEICWIKEETKKINIDDPICLDPTTGGGSIPFESIRLGINAYANDINPVASFIEKLTIEFPLLYGNKILDYYISITKKWRAKVEEKLHDLFPQINDPNTIDTTYLLARTIRCPYCGGLIPLSPNWRLSHGKCHS